MPVYTSRQKQTEGVVLHAVDGIKPIQKIIVTKRNCLYLQGIIVIVRDGAKFKNKLRLD
jgi:hypothetical protein